MKKPATRSAAIQWHQLLQHDKQPRGGATLPTKQPNINNSTTRTAADGIEKGAKIMIRSISSIIAVQSINVADARRYAKNAIGEVTEQELTYDLEFNSDTDSMHEGFRVSVEDCKHYIDVWNGTNHSYFEDFKGGTVSIRCNETEEVVYEEEVR